MKHELSYFFFFYMHIILEAAQNWKNWNQKMSKHPCIWAGVGNKLFSKAQNWKRVEYLETEPLLLQQGLRMLLVFPPPGEQLGLHGIHVLLDVVHDLTQRQGTTAHHLDGRAQPFNLFGHHIPLLFLRCFRHQTLKVEVEWRARLGQLKTQNAKLQTC